MNCEVRPFDLFGVRSCPGDAKECESINSMQHCGRSYSLGGLIFTSVGEAVPSMPMPYGFGL